MLALGVTTESFECEYMKRPVQAQSCAFGSRTKINCFKASTYPHAPIPGPNISKAPPKRYGALLRQIQGVCDKPSPCTPKNGHIYCATRRRSTRLSSLPTLHINAGGVPKAFQHRHHTTIRPAYATKRPRYAAKHNSGASRAISSQPSTQVCLSCPLFCII